MSIKDLPKDPRSIKRQPSWSFAELAQPFMQALMESKWFEVRKILNEEHYLFLTKSEEFRSDVKTFRKEFNVPKLDPHEDYNLMNVGLLEIEDSKWLRTNDSGFIDRWQRKLTELMEKYQLPPSYRDWVDWNILYGKPKGHPHYNLEGLLEILQNPYKTNNVGLTTNEKKLLLELIGMDIETAKGLKKRILKQIKPHIIKTASQNKNQRRRSRTLTTALKTLKIGSKETYFDYSLGEQITHKTTSTDLATSIFNDDTGKKASLVRKQKERLLRRHSHPQKLEK